jgi:hypothetical protein
MSLERTYHHNARILYAMTDRPERIQKMWAEYAFNYSSGLMPGALIYFTSDSTGDTWCIPSNTSRCGIPRYRLAYQIQILRYIWLGPISPIDQPAATRGFYDAFADLHLHLIADLSLIALQQGRDWSFGFDADLYLLPWVVV